jgi:hypothetical protein
MTSDHDTRQVRQQYELRPLIRSDGKRHPKYQSDLAKKKVPTTEIDSTENDGLLQLFYGPGKYLEVEVPNEEYSKQQSTIKDLIQTSARLGMRGEFDFLWRFSGTDLAEIIEFHKSWFEIINLYSHRSLTRHEDKLVAISGIASFIQRNTKFTYNSGLWQEIMSLNLLWTMISNPSARPQRSVPTWSWASVDGTIINRLREAVPPENNQFRSLWEDLVLHVDKEMQLLTTTKINDLVMSSSIELFGSIWPLKPGSVNVLWDILDVPSDNTLFVLPILSFTNP